MVDRGTQAAGATARTWSSEKDVVAIKLYLELEFLLLLLFPVALPYYQNYRWQYQKYRWHYWPPSSMVAEAQPTEVSLLRFKKHMSFATLSRSFKLCFLSWLKDNPSCSVITQLFMQLLVSLTSAIINSFYFSYISVKGYNVKSWVYWSQENIEEGSIMQRPKFSETAGPGFTSLVPST